MLGIDIFDASVLPAALVSVLAGLISFLSPCVLPIVPPYLAYMSGISLDHSSRKRNVKVILVATSFVLGLSTVFLILGLAASSFGILLLGYKDFLTTLAGLLIMGFGLHFLGIVHIPLLNREVRFDTGKIGGSFFGAYLLGLAFAFEIIERIMGLLLWTVGLLMLSGGFTDLSFWLLETFPVLGTLG